MSTTLFTDKSLRKWLSARGVDVVGSAYFIGVKREGVTIGCAAVANATEHDCQLFCAGETGFVTRKLLRALFRYVFDVLCCVRCTAIVSETNESALDLDYRLGFQVEGYLRHADGETGMMVLGMLKEECRFYG